MLLRSDAGINISGINGEVMPGQWEYQVGPCTGIDSPDQLIISRYLLIRVCEQFGVISARDGATRQLAPVVFVQFASAHGWF